MRTIPEFLAKDDILSDGGVVQSDEPVDHDTFVSVIVRYGNGEVRIRDFDKSLSLDVGRGRITWGPTGQGLPLEDDHANRAVDAYEKQRGL